MKKLDLIQGSKDWHDMRRRSLGASDAAVVMGVGYRSQYALWQEKLGLTDGVDVTYAMQRGIDLEPAARAWCERYFGVAFAPCVIQDDTHPWRIASLDGLSTCGKISVEIKCPKPGGTTELEAREGRVTAVNFPQLQQQRDILDDDIEHYYMVYDGTDGIILPAKKDVAYCADLIESSLKFWECVESMTPPEDGLKINRHDPEWIECSSEMLDAIKERADCELRYQKARKSLITLSQGVSTVGGGVTLTKSIPKPRIDYKLLASDSGLDIEHPEAKYYKVGNPTFSVRANT